ncbi:MAG: glycosyltransferase family 4 protein [Bacteroidaceae bacterium]|nr:glycosyltransferase family 4 protein [Bacteroidaceae bacterium]
MKKPVILFIAPFPPPIHGSSMMSRLIRESQHINDEFECSYVNMSTSRTVDEIGQYGITKIVRWFLALIITLWKLVRLKPDLCHISITCHGTGFIKDSLFVLLCKLFRKPIVIHQHNKGMSQDVSKWPYRWLLPLCYKDSTVILLSWHLYQDIQQVVNKEQVQICPNGIPGMPTEHKNASNSIPHLLFLSNLLPSKGVYVLLDAMQILKKQGLSFTCHFVGAESSEINSLSFLEESRKRGLEGMAIYVGKKYGKDKTEEFLQADIFIHPTNDDCFPLVILEAMQFGLPVITTNEGGIPDMVQDKVNGLICEKESASSLAHHIAFLINDAKKRQEMGRKGEQFYHDKYTTERFERRMTDILHQTLKHNSHHA